MKKLILPALLLGFSAVLSSCDFTTGSFKESAEGEVYDKDYAFRYITDERGFLLSFEIDKQYSFDKALDIVSFDVNDLTDNPVESSRVLKADVDACLNVINDSIVYEVDNFPKFININNEHYIFNSEPSVCSYQTYSLKDDLTDSGVSPIDMDGTRVKFRRMDFTTKVFTEHLYIEDFDYNATEGEWVRSVVKHVPMSNIQAGNSYDIETESVANGGSLVAASTTIYKEQLDFIAKYLVTFQNIDDIEPKPLDYTTNEELGNNTVWTDDTFTYVRELNTSGIDQTDLLLKVNIDQTKLIELFASIKVALAVASPF